MSSRPQRLPAPRARLIRLGVLAVTLSGFFALLVPLILAAGPGDLDPSFGGDGVVTTTIGTAATARGVVLQPDGKIILAGDSHAGGATGFALARYTPTGGLDPSFGTSGIVTTTTSFFASGKAVALQADGKIVVTGDSTSPGVTHFALARYTPTGGLDASFGTGGVVTTAIGTFAVGRSVALQADGKIVVAGYGGDMAGPWDFALARYTPAGALDPSFGTGGVVTTIIGQLDFGRSLALEADGKIVVAGDSGSFGGDFVFALARYTGDFSTYLPTIHK